MLLNIMHMRIALLYKGGKGSGTGIGIILENWNLVLGIEDKKR